MANKRMFSKHITNSEEFLEMPVSSQLLYFHLNMNADDDGFVQPTRIIRMTNCANKDDLSVLHAKGFVIKVADKVIVIRHWHVNNTLRKDRYSPSIYQEHLKFLGIDDNKIYNKSNGLPNGNQMVTQVSIDKVSIVEDSIDKVSENNVSKEILNFWNNNKIIVHKDNYVNKIKSKINTILKDYDINDIKQSIDRYNKILLDEKYYWSHKWELADFLQRGFEKFRTDIAFENYLIKENNKPKTFGEMQDDLDRRFLQNSELKPGDLLNERKSIN